PCHRWARRAAEPPRRYRAFCQRRAPGGHFTGRRRPQRRSRGGRLAPDSKWGGGGRSKRSRHRLPTLGLHDGACQWRRRSPAGGAVGPLRRGHPRGAVSLGRASRGRDIRGTRIRYFFRGFGTGRGNLAHPGRSLAGHRYPRRQLERRVCRRVSRRPYVGFWIEVTMKRIVLLAALLLLNPACKRTAQEVVVYTSVDQVFSEPIFKEFERKSGITVRAVFDTEETKSTGVLNRLI